MRWDTGRAVSAGIVSCVVSRPALTDIMAAWPDGFTRLYLSGPAPAAGIGDVRRWAMPAELPDGWELDKAPHHLADARTFVLHFRRHGQPVSILRAAPWFGEGDHDPGDVLAAFGWLWRELRETWGTDAGIFDTPQTTGRDLWARMIERSDGYPVLPGEVRHLIQSHSPQGRIEGWWDRGVARAATVPLVEEWDGTLMYAALCADLGIGPVRAHDEDPSWPGPEHGGVYAPAWYQVSFEVPDTWADTAPDGIVSDPRRHVGLLGVPTGDGWTYPTRGRHTTWVAGPELKLAVECYGAGAVQIRQRLILTRDGGKGPLAKWADRLVSLRGRAAAIESPVLRAMCQRAARAIILTAIGAFAARTRQRTVTGDDTIEGLTDWTVVDGGGYVWTEDEPGQWAAMAHPEWAAYVWSKCRARMMSHRGTGALHVHPDDLLAVYVDALFVSSDEHTATWRNDETAGHLRKKMSMPGPVQTPAGWADLWAMRGTP